MKRIFLVFMLSAGLFAEPTELFTNEYSCKTEKCDEEKVCCKLKYPGGGYDFILTTRGECMQSQYFHLIKEKNDALCFEWKGEGW